MKRRMLQLTALLLTILMLSGCGIGGLLPNVTKGQELPHLMVSNIHVSMNPYDPDFERHYVTQENLTALLNLLRTMPTSDLTEEEPHLSDSQTYYTVTASYACGETRVYYLLGYRFLKVGDEPWCEIQYEDAMKFSQFIRDRYSDDGSYTPPPTESVPETSLTAETEPTEQTE